MSTTKQPSRTKKIIKRILWIILFLALGTLVYLYYNFNRILSDALLKNFNGSINSNVYELSFEKLRVNILDGDVGVLNVEIKPREKPLGDYPYINSSFHFSTKRIQLTNLQIRKLIHENKFEVEKIEIVKPEIELNLTGKFPIFFPIKDSSEVKHEKSDKKFIENFYLDQFRLEDASISLSNEYKKRSMKIDGFNITIDSIKMNQEAHINDYFVGNLSIKVKKFSGKLFHGPFSQIAIQNYSLEIDSIHINRTIDTLVYDFSRYELGFDSLDLNTPDSVANLKLASFDLNYEKKNIHLKGLSFKPNISQSEIQKKQKYQNSQVELQVGDLNIENINFDSLIYNKSLFIDKISLDSVAATIFKNNAKPIDTSKFPPYLGQMIKSVKIPLRINQLTADHANIISLEMKPDGSIAAANVNRGQVTATNITNLDDSRPLAMTAEVFLENKVHVHAELGFSYTQPQFTLKAKLRKFNLTDLNSVIAAYTPAKIKKGIVDEISFGGIVYNSYSTGTMKFLYHDLDVDLDLKDKAKWKSAVGAFAANAYVVSSNPPEGLPERVVKYRVDRNMNRGFVNIIIKSALMGLKETMMMSKENRKAYKEKKKKMREKNKK